MCFPALLSPLLSDEARQTPYWQAWVAHVAVLEVALRDDVDLSTVLVLDERIQTHHRLFLKVHFEPPVTSCVTPCVTHCVTQREHGLCVHR